MAGQLKVNGVTLATEESGTVTLEAPQIKDSSNNVILDQSGTNPVLKNVEVVNNSSMMFRNKTINGNFDIWQRGTSQTSSGYGSADRWQNVHSGSTKTASQQAFTLGQTDVPGNPKYYLRHVVSSVAGSGNRVLVNQRIEGVSTLAGQTVTLSFWAKADSNKSIATEFVHNFGTGGSPSSALTSIEVTTHNLTTSWQKFTATVSIPSISGKTIGSDNNDYISFAFWFDAGSDYNSRTNSLGQQSGTFDIAQVQLEVGTVATQFEHRPYGMELNLCQRYCQVIKGLGGSGASGQGFAVNGRMNGGGAGDCQYNFPHVMRASPTAEVDFDSAYFEYGSVSLAVSGMSAGSFSPFGANLRANVSGGANGNACVFRLTGSTQINFEAEL